MGFFHGCLGLVTAQAQPAAGCFELAIIVAAVGAVAGSALPVPIGLVGMGIGLLGLFVAPETKLRFSFDQQAGELGGMRRVTTGAGALLDRLMQNFALVHPGFGLPMTAVAEFPLFFQQQATVARGMGIVTALATLFGYRWMRDSPFEFGAFMTVEAGGRETPGRGEQPRKQSDNDDQMVERQLFFHCRPPE